MALVRELVQGVPYGLGGFLRVVVMVLFFGVSYFPLLVLQEKCENTF